MSFLGSQFWHKGPDHLDWVLDLETGRFGPLHGASTLDDVKQHLGRPDDAQVLGKPHRCHYHRFDLFIELEEDLTIWELELSTQVDDPQRTSYDPPVKLPGGKTVNLRALTAEDLKGALGEPTRVEGSRFHDHFLEFAREGFDISVEVSGEQQILGIALTTPDA